MAAYGYRILDLSENGPPEEVAGLGVTASLLPMLGIQPYLGRTIVPAEDAPDVKVVVLSYRLWQRRFNGNPKLIGNQISLSGEKYTVIGVMPKGFQFPNQQSEFWVPLGLTQDLLARRNSHFLRVVGRLTPQLNLQQAQKDLDVVAR
jgi:putative ABC transport system permease protein